MAQNSLAAAHPATRPGILPRKGWRAHLLTMLDLRRSRLDLEHLEDSRLGDIGLTRDQARAEAGRPVWDVPANWRR